MLESGNGLAQIQLHIFEGQVLIAGHVADFRVAFLVECLNLLLSSTHSTPTDRQLGNSRLASRQKTGYVGWLGNGPLVERTSGPA